MSMRRARTTASTTALSVSGLNCAPVSSTARASECEIFLITSSSVSLGPMSLPMSSQPVSRPACAAAARASLSSG